MLLQGSIVHEFVNKDTFTFFLAKAKELYQVSVMYPWEKSHLSIEWYIIHKHQDRMQITEKTHVIVQQLHFYFSKRK